MCLWLRNRIPYLTGKKWLDKINVTAGNDMIKHDFHLLNIFSQNRFEIFKGCLVQKPNRDTD